jgi:hypothetical protein
MKNKVQIVNVLGSVGQSEKGFIRQYVVKDFSGGDSVIKVFARELASLPEKVGAELTVDCNEFCFVSK